VKEHGFPSPEQRGGTAPLVISEPADIVFFPALQAQRAGPTTRHFPCLCTGAASWRDQALPGRTRNSGCPDQHGRTAQSGKYGNCLAALKMPGLPPTDCGRDGNSPMPEVIISRLDKQWHHERPRELSRTAAAAPASPSERDASQSPQLRSSKSPSLTEPGLNSLLEAQPSPAEKSRLPW